jgi:hypothetical protein
MATTITAPSAPELAANAASLTDNPSPQTIQSEFRDAGELRAEYDSINNLLEAKASSLKQLIDEEVIPLLRRMHALLGQRSPEHLREAHLPTWTGYYRIVQEKFNLKSISWFQRQVALTERPAKVKTSAPKRRPKPTTGFTSDDAGFNRPLIDMQTTTEQRARYKSGGYAADRRMLIDLMAQIQQLSDQVPKALMETVGRYAEIMNVRPTIVPHWSSPKRPKPMTLLERAVARAVKEGRGTLIRQT